MFYGAIDAAHRVFGGQMHNIMLRKEEFWALDDISFELKRGECLGVIGPNGAGKSTLLKLLNGIISPDKGEITVFGRVGVLIQVGAGFHPNLTGRENIYINGQILGMDKTYIGKKFDEIVDFAEIGDFLDTPVKFYSSGMFVRLGFAIAIHMEPDVLLIDEILAVGDAGFRSKCYNAIGKLQKNTAIILISHSMPTIDKTCTHSLVIDKGKEIFHGKSIDAIEKYLELFDSSIDSIVLEKDGLSCSGFNIFVNGIETNVINYGDNVTFRILINSEYSIQLESRLIFHRKDMLEVAECYSPMVGKLINFKNGKSCLQINIKEFILSSSQYIVSFGFLYPDRIESPLWYRGAAQITVKSRVHCISPCHMISTWELN